nr:putative reverse transcriptase domain-containing protein [Tanacetum cinerariifolium]
MGLFPTKGGKRKAAMKDKDVVSPKKTTNLKKKTTKKTQETEEPAAPKKATTSSKKKFTKRKLIMSDEYEVSKNEVEYRPLSRKKRVPKAVLIQEPPSVPVKQTYESSGKHKDLSDNDDRNEYEDDDDERVETDDDRDDEEEDDDRSTDIKETDAERTESDDEHQGKGYADMNIKQEVEKEMADEKPKEPFHIVTMSVIPESTQGPPPPATKTVATQVPNTEAVSSVVQRFFKMEKFVKQLKETDFGLVIHDSIKSQVPSIVEKYLGSSLLDAFHKELHANNAELKKELSNLNYKELINKSGKEMKKRRTRKETESLKKSSTPKESTKDDVDQTFDKKADDIEQLSLNVASNPKRQKNDWSLPMYVQKAFDNRCTYTGGASSKEENIKVACPRLNRALSPGGSYPNQVRAIEGGQGHGNNGNQAHGGAFMMGAEEASQDPNIMTGLEEQMERMSDGAWYYLDRIWVLLTDDVRTLIMDEAHKSKYSIHLGADKMYYGLRDMYWWSGMKKDVALYVSKCLTCSKIKAGHQRSSALLQHPEIPKWKWERIAIDFITNFPRTKNGHDAIWVIVDQLTKSTEDIKMDR